MAVSTVKPAPPALHRTYSPWADRPVRCERTATLGRSASQVGNIVSVVLRGSTQNYLDDVERAVEDGAA